MRQVHGGNLFAHPVRYDFSANLNPLGMPEGVRRAVIENAWLWEHYPDPDCTALVQKLAAYEGIPATHIVCGNGADDLIYRITAALRPETAFLCAPSFGEYRKALEEQDCEVRLYYLREEDGFSLTEGYQEALTPDMQMAILCTPNNPTGRCISKRQLAEIIALCQWYGTTLLIDGCFLDFTEDGRMLNSLLREHVILLKAFTKTYAMPGLRLGYALFGDADLAARVKQTGQFWSVSAPAQAAGIAALEEQAYFTKTKALIRTERQFLTEALTKTGVKVYPSDANFLLFRSVPGLAEQLLRENILIRSCESFEGLDERFYRIAVRTHARNEVLMDALRRCLHG